MIEDTPWLLSLLDQLEACLQAESLWSEGEPDAQALASSLPFCVDTLSLPEWIQFVLIRRVRTLSLAGQPLPSGASILPVLDLYLSQTGLAAPATRRVIMQLEHRLNHQV